MNLKIQNNCSNVDWDYLSQMLGDAQMAHFKGEIHKKAFENSYVVIFIFDDNKLIGFGRAISDGVYQAAIYDVAVSPEYQGKGIGKLIIENILKNLTGFSVILYSSPGKERFYERLSFRKMKTGMAIFSDTEKMKTNGFTE